MGFISTWRDYLKTRSDSPPAFAIPSALTTLAVALGNRCYVHGWNRRLYPNLWVVLIAPSGYGKGAPLDLGTAVLERAGMEDLVLPESFSLEALIWTLAKKPVGIFSAQEFSAFVAKLSSSYNDGATEFITSLYDGGENAARRRIRDPGSEDGWREIVIHRPAITMLGASSPEWFAQSFSESALRGGFMARMVFVPSSTPGEWVGLPGAPDDRVMSILAGHLRQLSTLFGEFDVSHVRPAFDAWDRAQRQELRESTDPEFSGLKSRAGALALKMSMLFAVSRDPTTRAILAEDFKHATQMVEGTMKIATKYLQSQIPRNKPEATRLKIMEILARSPRKPHAEMLAETHISAYELKGMVETLSESEQLRIERDDATGKIVYVATPRLVVPVNGNGRSGSNSNG